ncbi:hypothetical protein ACTSKR_10700 [Chitinibacteraceae bacterium HSL-7]
MPLAKSLLATLLATMACHAAAEARFSLDVAPIWQADSDLDGGGKVSSNSVKAGASAWSSLNERWSAGATVSYTHLNWSFSEQSQWGQNGPWGDAALGNVGVQLTYRADNSWFFSVAPSVGFAAEQGANRKALWGGTASATKAFSRDLKLGLGVAAYDNIDETKVYPFLIVDWQINDHWKLANPFAAGPTGPAGLELSYQQGSWDVGAGGAMRSYRFRLNDRNPNAAGGIGEESALPLFLRFGYAPTDNLRVDLYVGGLFDHQYDVADRDGNLLTSDSTDVSPVFAIHFGGRF